MTTDREELLIVDDDEAVRESLGAWLEDSGYLVSEAANGQEALTRCRQAEPALLLCDLRMPVMDGLQLLAVVAEEFPHLPFIIVSGQGEVRDVIQALKLGAWDYISKPINDMEMLEHAIRRALEQARLRRENQQYQAHLEAANEKLRLALDRMSADEEAGRELQFQMLPENGKRFADLSCHYRLLPSATLSGDFVDYFRIDAHHLGFYLADVSGHGIPSALVTVILKNTMSRYLQSCWQQQDALLLDPAATLMQLNRLFLASELNKHVAIFYGIVDLDQHTLSYCSAGHFPFAIIRQGEKTAFEGYKSPPVGLFSEVDYRLQSCTLGQSFDILLVSDGIFEILPQATLEEKEAALLSLSSRAEPDLEALVDSLGLDGTGDKLPDDITFLLIRGGAT